ncbi:alpha/beta fold hydrolase [Oscillatoria salina]|uniref:alpha/beta fold hydrolase n=1 Tax=Oscillatoria salina TaxID=331517 RepID=UPI0013BCFF90|nr:alpha/beta fold hydrolase [Oscillatoria salina]MBZ8181309.1 alpha/beta fold hydrolase [Oscillatoria salina IIICB1]NET90733.1 alpha/beta fold hydrolase [Kamptonema sp. SIO1D9]
MTGFGHWQQRIGSQRDWVWRGWQTRYTYLRADLDNPHSSTPLILLHGFGTSIEHWRKNFPDLSRQHTVYALDLLGFGASQKVPVEYNSQLWLEQVYDFWRTFIQQPVVLVGNSIGSLICLVAAATYPEMVKGVVLLSLPDVTLRQETIPKPLQPLVMGIERTVASPPVLKLLFRLLRTRRVIRRWAAIAYANSTAIDPELVEILATPAQDRGASRTFAALFRAISSPNFAPPVKVLLPHLSIPILLIWGRQDRMVPSSLAHQFATLNSQVQLVELDNVGHCPHDECPEQFNQILLAWLQAQFPVTRETEPDLVVTTTPDF